MLLRLPERVYAYESQYYVSETITIITFSPGRSHVINFGSFEMKIVVAYVMKYKPRSKVEARKEPKSKQ